MAEFTSRDVAPNVPIAGNHPPHAAEDTALSDHTHGIPQAPWLLHGRLTGSLWRVPTHALPQLGHPVRARELLGQSLVITMWACYRRGSTLTYNELAVAVASTGRRWAPWTATIPLIWVDDDTAAAGGIVLWNIPKRLARFDHRVDRDDAFEGSLLVGHSEIARLRYDESFAAPARVPLAAIIVQPGEGAPRHVHCSARGRLGVGRAHWRFAPDGPLAFLAGRRPLLTWCLNDAQLQFGR